ncbi:MAG: adenylyltransferase/cytidyltransferase family protein [Patescibacteria group bacterium]|jgi:D-beta-D-heptose 7-phosphate kinase/D-beta-D-heptose 1-phosphate adenosyltransferase
MTTDKKIIKYADLAKVRRNVSKNRQTIAFTSGCYDMLHMGHIIHFNYCKSKGDILVVSVGNDQNVSELKGPSRPIVTESFRARHIAALACVDYVVISEEMGIMDHNRMLELLKPDIYVVPVSDKLLNAKKELVSRNGGKVHTCRRIPPEHLKGGISTTKLEEKIRKNTSIL